jgi:iron complex outermembrane receptor protein
MKEPDPMSTMPDTSTRLRPGPFRISAALVMATLGWLPVVATAQQNPDLGSASLADLMRMTVEPVFGASLRLQPVTEAPASVTIVTADDIRRYGYRTLADILEAVRGFYVTNDRNYSYVGIRGISQPGDYNTRVLLTINGHRINDGVYDQASIGADLGLDPMMIDRVEIIRGAGSSLYGTSAFLAVVNIITRTGNTMNPGTVWLNGGSQDTVSGGVAVAHTFSNGLAALLSASGSRSDGNSRLYFPEFDDPATNNGIAVNADAENARQIFGHVAFKHLRLTALASWRNKTVPTAAYDTTFNDPGLTTGDGRALLDLQYDRSFGQTALTLRSYVNRYKYEGLYPYGEDGVFFDEAVAVVWGGEARATRPLPGRQTLTLGGEFRNNVRQDQRGGTDGVLEFDIRQSSRVVGLYVQDEVELTPRWRVIAGARYDDYAGFSRLTPRAGLIFNPSTNGAVKYLYGTAFRAPNSYELDYYVPVAHEPLGPERITTHEIVWEQYVSDWLRTSASVYRNDVRDLITLTTSPDGELVFRNEGQMRGKGLGLEAEVRLRSGFQALGSYSLQESIDVESDADLINSPRHLARLRFSAAGPTDGSTFALESSYISSRRTIAGTHLSGTTVSNFTATWPIGPDAFLEGSIRNLFAADYAEPASAEHLQASIPQDGRTTYIGLRWSFGRKDQ